MAPSGASRRVSYPVSDSMSCIRRERVPVPCAELALRMVSAAPGLHSGTAFCQSRSALGLGSAPRRGPSVAGTVQACGRFPGEPVVATLL